MCVPYYFIVPAAAATSCWRSLNFEIHRTADPLGAPPSFVIPLSAGGWVVSEPGGGF